MKLLRPDTIFTLNLKVSCPSSHESSMPPAPFAPCSFTLPHMAMAISYRDPIVVDLS